MGYHVKIEELLEVQSNTYDTEAVGTIRQTNTRAEKAERDSQPLGKWRDDRLCFLYGTAKHD